MKKKKAPKPRKWGKTKNALWVLLGLMIGLMFASTQLPESPDPATVDQAAAVEPPTPSPPVQQAAVGDPPPPAAPRPEPTHVSPPDNAAPAGLEYSQGREQPFGIYDHAWGQEQGYNDEVSTYRLYARDLADCIRQFEAIRDELNFTALLPVGAERLKQSTVSNIDGKEIILMEWTDLHPDTSLAHKPELLCTQGFYGGSQPVILGQIQVSARWAAEQEE